MPYVRSNAADIYWESHGEGAPLLLVHGAGGNTVVWWQQVHAFAKQHRVILYDHRCFGKSQCDPSDFQARYFADDLIAVMDAAGVERAALVGMSMGGWSVLPAALAHPERVSKLVLCGTPGGVFTEGVLHAMIEIGRGAAQENSDSLRGRLTFSDRFARERPEMVHLYDEISALNVGVKPTMLAAIAAEEVRISEAQLAGFEVPTLLVAAEEDKLFPVPVLREVAELIPGCQWVDFHGAGHSMYFEDPEQFERVVLPFVAVDGAS